MKATEAKAYILKAKKRIDVIYEELCSISDYENEYESIMLELTDEQFNRYCDALRRWEATDEWKNWDIENGDDYFIHRDLPDIWQLLVEFAEFARMKSVSKVLKLGKTDRI